MRFVSRAIPLRLARLAERCARAAAKRDPKRDSAQKKQSKLTAAYATVLAEWEVQRSAQTERVAILVSDLRNGPLISVIVPVYNPEPSLLSEMIKYLRSQSYSNWELCIADDCSPNEEVRDLLRSYAAHDSRDSD